MSGFVLGVHGEEGYALIKRVDIREEMQKGGLTLREVVHGMDVSGEGVLMMRDSRLESRRSAKEGSRKLERRNLGEGEKRIEIKHR